MNKLKKNIHKNKKKLKNRFLSKEDERKTLTFKHLQSIIKNEGGNKIFKITKENSTQNIIPIKEIKEKGIIKLKNGKYIKIIKIFPINYELKSELEKNTILNSYKTFLKTCNFNMQILIQSNRLDIKKHLFILEQEKNKTTKEKIKYLYNDHINYMKKINSENCSSSKNFYIIVHQNDEIKENPNNEIEKIIIENLNEKYFKIKENLSKCGNFIYEIEKNETLDIFYSFFNYRKQEKSKEV